LLRRERAKNKALSGILARVLYMKVHPIPEELTHDTHAKQDMGCIFGSGNY
jgi:hypothetical protein